MQSVSKMFHLAYPIFEPPSFAEAVEAFIRERARRDLPVEQFTGMLDPTNPDHYREIAGTLDYRDSEGIIELGYAHPEESKVMMRGGRVIGSEAAHGYFDTDEFDKMEHLVDYHNHPGGTVEEFIMSDSGHVEGLGKLVEQLIGIGATIKDLYFALYLPHKDRVHWFKQDI